MKYPYSLFAFVALLSMPSLCSSSQAHDAIRPAQESRLAIGMDRPWQTNDGLIHHQGRTFKSWSAYFQSQRSEGILEHRCGTQAVPPDDADIDGSLAFHPPSDCSCSNNNAASEYDPSEGLLRIPCVVHVIRNSSGSLGDISVDRVISGIRILNEDFKALAGTNGSNGNDAQIEFYLATVDPNGNPTDGMTFSNNDIWYNDEGSYWNSLSWDPTRYMNIYTTNAKGLLGYVPFLPACGSPGSASDRVVVLSEAYGENAPIGSPYNLGRTLTHEVGHYLGLYHTFSGCDGGSCSTLGDLICDTSPQDFPTFGCNGSGSSCSGGVPVPDDNYMDYSDDQCMEQFTPEQNKRMRCSLEYYRPELADDCTNDSPDSDADGTPDCVDGCPDDPEKVDVGLCGCGISDVDTDLDGVPDCTDGCPNDVNKTEPGACGCGESDEDLNDNGIPDCNDNGDGQTIVVDDDLQQDPNADYTRIQDAVDAAEDGATILVQPGRYTSSSDNVVFIQGKGVRLIGVGGYSATIIDCEDSRGGIRAELSSIHTLVVEGFTVQSYSGCFSAGGDPPSCNSGILVVADPASSATIESCVIRDGVGFALTLNGRPSNNGNADLLVRNTMVLDNVGPSNSGADWLMAAGYSASRYESCAFIGNTAGQMMFCYLTSTEFTDCVFVDNELVPVTTSVPGAVLCHSPSQNETMTITDCRFVESSNGCVVYTYGADDVQINTSFACSSSGIPTLCGKISAQDIVLTDVCADLDCNENGITDAIEIFDGSAADIDNNGVIDCCESGQPCKNFIQWKIGDGGNGHWYERVPADLLCEGDVVYQRIHYLQC